MSEVFFLQLKRVSLVIGLAAVVLASVSFLWEKGRFSIRWRKRLWGVFAALLFIGPFLPLPDGVLVLPVPEKSVVLPLPAQAEGAEADQDAVHFQPHAPEDGEGNTPDTGSELNGPRPLSLDLSAVLHLLWLAGTTCFLLWFAVLELRRSRNLRRWGQPVTDAELLAVYGALRGNQKRFPELVTAPGLSGAMLAGLFRPKLLLPCEGVKPEAAAYVLRHELAHWRQHDLWLKLLALLANALHWWNPAVWLVRTCLEKDIEWACDEVVLKDADLSERKAYGAVLLSAAGRRQKPLTTAFAGDAKVMKRRLEAILVGKKRSGALPTVLAAAGAVCLLFLVSCSSAPHPASPSPAQTSGSADVLSSANRSVLVLGRALDVYTDVIMLAEFDAEAPALRVTSIPRDFPVEYASSTVKLGYVYDAAGGGETGLEAVKERVAALTGVTPDDTVLLDTQALSVLVDAVGGVTFDVPVDMDYEDPAQGLSIHLRKGKQLLHGEQAAALVRYRRGTRGTGFKNGDLGRIATQQAFLRTLLEQLLHGTDELRMLGLISTFQNNVTTTLGVSDCIGLARSAIECGLDGQDITFATLQPD